MTEAKTTTPPPLHCLGGAAAPSWVAGDLARLAALPKAARDHLWDVLGPALPEDRPAGLDATIDRFRRAHDAAGQDLERTLRASRYLVRRAAARDLERALFAEDVAALLGSADGSALIEGYEIGRAVVRRELVRAMLAEHGPVVDGISWRVEVITGSSESETMRVPVASLTLRYKDGDRKDKLTLQLTQDALRELKRLCDRAIVGRDSAPAGRSIKG